MEGKKLSLWQAVAMAVGTMIGASIFSIFGYGVKIAGNGLPIAFFISGIYALMVAYSYAHLGRKYVSNAGPIAFIQKAFGNTVWVGALSILMWFSYVVAISLFAISFAGYLLPLIHLNYPTLHTVTEVFVVAFFGALSYFGGSRAVGKLEFWIVSLKLTILLLFIVAGLKVLHIDYLKPQISQSYLKGILNASVIFFLSYMGFGLVTNISENLENPWKNVPRAIFISIFIVMFVYVGVSVSAIGALPTEELIKYAENALAVAAEPMLGKFGFVLLSLGALISISSALNATIYTGANASYALMRDGYIPVPHYLVERKWLGEHLGLYITSSLGLLFALLFNVTSVASIVSIVTSVLYIGVILSHLKLWENVGGRRGLIFFNLIVITFVVFQILTFQFKSSKLTFYTTILLFLTSFLLELFYYGKRRRVSPFIRTKKLLHSSAG
ncbi:amino acid:proton symporter, ABT family [Balnearium lithotrophicum]|uniref:Amino acid:proton symporter, ABT family n=1 Tax=Balnearium lithotrophicum TaxID=223788 RepID=A0A521C3K6_9BACT|nr:APC family permease [Balnearium lithotrophicum]SMO54022.1 amino acid:proton symporter, ABT family [Balnearium lithotrophicum]